MNQIIRGSGKGAPGSASDSLFSDATASVLDAICEGPIEGLQGKAAGVFLNGVPVYDTINNKFNFSGVTYSERKGGVDNITPLNGFDRIESQVPNPDASTPLETGRPRQIFIQSNESNTIKFVAGLNGLYYTDPSTGSAYGSLVSFTVKLRELGVSNTTRDLSFYTIHKNTAANLDGIAEFPAETSLADVYIDSYTNYGNVTIKYRLVGTDIWITSSTVTLEKYRNRKWVGSEDNGNYIDETKYRAHATITGLDASLLYEASLTLDTGSTLTSNYNISCTIPEYNVTIEGKTTTTYNKDYEISVDPANGPFYLEITKTSYRKGSTDVEELRIISVSTVIDSKLTYPYTALMALSVNARDFSSIPVRGYRMKLLKVQIPSNYNPTTREYTGAWNGLFKPDLYWTDNPVWCYYDLITNNRFGLGSFIDPSLIDIASLYTIAKYCDELVPDGDGGTEPRFTCNVYIQDRQDAYGLLNSLASIFRGMTYWDSARGLSLVQDAPTATSGYFNNTNVVDGVFNYSGSASQARHTVALVTWNDPTDNYRQKIEYVEDTEGILRYGVNQVEVRAFGCTSRGQAHRYGKQLLYTEVNEVETVTFQSGLVGSQIFPGEVIEISDKYRAGVRQAGRIVNSYAINNSILNSTDLSGWLTTGGTLVQRKGLTGPDSLGINSTVWELTDDTSTGNHKVYTTNIPVVAGIPQNISIKLKPGIVSPTYVSLVLKGGTDEYSVFINTITNEVVFSSILNGSFFTQLTAPARYQVSNGWVELILNAVFAGTNIASFEVVMSIDPPGDISYVGTDRSILISEPLITSNTARTYFPTTGIASSSYAIVVDKLEDRTSSIASNINYIDTVGNYVGYTNLGISANNEVVLVTTPATLPIVNSIWSISAPTLPTQWRVISVTEDSPGVYGLACMQYTSGKYDYLDFGTSLEPRNTSILDNLTIAAVSLDSIKYYIESRKIAFNQWSNILVLDWVGVSLAQSYTVKYSINKSNLISNPPVETSYFEIPSVKGGDSVYVEITSVGVLGALGGTTVLTIEIPTTVSVPGNVTNFRGTSVGDTIQLSWDIVTNDPDLSHYEIRFSPLLTGAIWNASNILVDNISKELSSISLPNSTGTYLIKAKDYAGLYSDVATEFVSTFKTSTTFTAYIEEDVLAPGNWPGTKLNTAITGNVLQLDPVPMYWSMQSTDTEESIVVDGSGITYDTATSIISLVGTKMPLGFDLLNPYKLATGTTISLRGFVAPNLLFNGDIELTQDSTNTTLVGKYIISPGLAYTNVVTEQVLVVTYGIPISNVGNIAGDTLANRWVGYYELTGSGGATPVPYDAGSVVSIRLTPDIIAYATSAATIFISQWTRLSTVQTLTGATAGEAGGYLEYSHSDDTVTWSIWKPLIVAGDIRCRYIKFRLALYTGKVSVIAEASKASVYIL